MKLKWKVQPAPTGRYRSFQQRGWPQAWYLGPNGEPEGDLAAAFVSVDEGGHTYDYDPRDVKTGKHPPLKAYVYDYRAGRVGRKMLTLIKTFPTLAEAKAAIEAFLARHPELAPQTSREVA